MDNQSNFPRIKSTPIRTFSLQGYTYYELITEDEKHLLYIKEGNASRFPITQEQFNERINWKDNTPTFKFYPNKS